MRLIIPIFLLSISILFSQGDPGFVGLGSANFSLPVAIANAGDGTNRLFIAEKRGRIEIVSNLVSGNTLVDPFLDITSIVDASQNEQGLLGLAFHPDYENNGYFYVNYIFDPGFSSDVTRVSRFTVTGDANIADPNSELLLLEFPQPFTNHNGGDLHFGPDGYLYISTGDGGGSGDPQNNGQTTSNLLGKILRIDVDGDDFPADPLKNYAIPSDNPFLADATIADEIYHYGLRNPWRMSFDALTGDLYIGDVGQWAREEIDFIPAGTSGLNLGWKCMEGFSQFSNTSSCNSGVQQGIFYPPIFDIQHNTAESITGGHVYRGNTFTDLQGWYFCIDFLTNRMWQLKRDVNGNWQDIQVTGLGVSNISGFGVSENNEMYAVSYGGNLYRLIDKDVCTQTINVPTPSNPEYLAYQSITSNGTVSNSPVAFKAPEITLNPNFNVPLMTIFEAINGICGSQ